MEPFPNLSLSSAICQIPSENLDLGNMLLGPMPIPGGPAVWADDAPYFANS